MEETLVASLKKVGDTDFVCFRLGGRDGLQFRRFFGTNKSEADARKKPIEAMLHDINTGRVKVPDNVDVGLFIVPDRQVTEKHTAPVVVTLRQGFDQYLESAAFLKKADTTRITERAHIRTICRILKKSTPIRSLTSKELQQYISFRMKEDGIRGKKVQPRTIQKELATLSVIWNDFCRRGSWNNGSMSD